MPFFSGYIWKSVWIFLWVEESLIAWSGYLFFFIWNKIRYELWQPIFMAKPVRGCLHDTGTSFIPVPTCSSVFIYMIPVWVRVIPVRVHSGSHTGTKRSYLYEIWPHSVPVSCKGGTRFRSGRRWVAELTGMGSECVSIVNNTPKWLVRTRAHKKLRVIPVKWLPCKCGTKLDFVPVSCKHPLTWSCFCFFLFSGEGQSNSSVLTCYCDMCNNNNNTCNPPEGGLCLFKLFREEDGKVKKYRGCTKENPIIFCNSHETSKKQDDMAHCCSENMCNVDVNISLATVSPAYSPPNSK